MSEKEFIESQKECAAMLGMSLSEYQEYCKKVKVPKNDNEICECDNTTQILELLGIDSGMLKKRKD